MSNSGYSVEKLRMFSDTDRLFHDQLTFTWQQLAENVAGVGTDAQQNENDQLAKELCRFVRGDVSFFASFFETFQDVTHKYPQWEEIPEDIQQAIPQRAEQGVTAFLLHCYLHLPREIAAQWMTINPSHIPTYFDVVRDNIVLVEGKMKILGKQIPQDDLPSQVLTYGLTPDQIAPYYPQISGPLEEIFGGINWVKGQGILDNSDSDHCLKDLKELGQKIATCYVSQQAKRKRATR